MNRRIGALLLALLLASGGPALAEGAPGAEAAAAAEEAARETANAEPGEAGEKAGEAAAAPETAAREAGTKAADISEHCTFNNKAGGPRHMLNDGAYNRVFETGPRNGVHSVEIRVTEGEPMGALYIQWAGDPGPAAVQVPDGEDWVTVATTDGSFFADYIPIPECTVCRVTGLNSPHTQLRISELRVLTAGTPPENIQVWRKPEGKVDMILLSGHPDDELLWFGGALPYYAGELKKDVLVICCAMTAELRRLELCDALWACGVRIHPIYMHRLDFSDTNIKTVLKKWHAEDEVKGWVIGYFRRFRPDVLLLHDVNGEYGHGIHKAASWLGTECARLAADPEADPASAAAYGTWQTKKIYVHLAEENQIRMDWKKPLEAFGGKTGLEAAQDALSYHKSQVVHGWAIQDGGDMDNALFGLVYTSVGPDVEKNDFFEHIE